jgi:transcriptional regulator with XRE-family HTH domain
VPKPRPLPLKATLRFLRFASGWSEHELARALGVSPALISGYEQGEKPLSRERLEELLAVLEIPPEAIDGSLYALELAFPRDAPPGSPVDPTSAERRSLQRMAAVAGQRMAEAVRERLTQNLQQWRAARARRQAGELWKTLQKLPPRRRRAAVEREEQYWTWAVAERLCEESARAAAHRADGAVELASLALRVAELSPGSETWRSRLQGYAWAFVANARRVHGDLPGAEEAFLRSDHLWAAGADADPGLLDAARLLDLKASLRSYQGRLDEALALLDQALRPNVSKEARGRILIKKATNLELMGEYERAIATLREADLLMEGSLGSRPAWLVRFTLVANLRQLGRYEEAEALLPEVRDWAIALSNELDLVRVLWLEGEIAAGLGRSEEALPALEQVRRYFTSNRIAYDAALASLEVSVLYLEQERTSEVRGLAAEMLWIFKAQGVHQEALAALRLFCEAADKEEATAELARRVAEYLGRARNNPGLRFEP